MQTADSRSHYFFVVCDRFSTPFQLARDGLGLVHKQNHDVNRGVSKINAERRVVILAAQHIHLVHEQLQAFHLDVSAGKSVNDHAVRPAKREAHHSDVTTPHIAR